MLLNITVDWPHPYGCAALKNELGAYDKQGGHNSLSAGKNGKVIKTLFI